MATLWSPVLLPGVWEEILWHVFQWSNVTELHLFTLPENTKLWLYQSEWASGCQHLRGFKPQVSFLAHALCSSGLAETCHIILCPGFMLMEKPLFGIWLVIVAEGKKAVVNCALFLKALIPLVPTFLWPKHVLGSHPLSGIWKVQSHQKPGRCGDIDRWQSWIPSFTLLVAKYSVLSLDYMQNILIKHTSSVQSAASLKGRLWVMWDGFFIGGRCVVVSVSGLRAIPLGPETICSASLAN